MKKNNFIFFFFDKKIHKPVERIEALQLADAQSTGLGRRGHRRILALDGAVYLSSKIWQRITTVSFVSAFIIVSNGRPENAYKWVYIGSKPIAVVFKSLLL